ncbi:putative toxin [Skermanella stibiiresistens]|uniref:putative toxin n=1 Tax=Skermanella stibiiresistens TaxID=913326 RepID=UPI001FDF685B|nr:putative toxin [Skermanella stibiiresistens]
MSLNKRFGDAFEAAALSAIRSVVKKTRSYSHALRRITYPDARTDTFLAEVKSGAEVTLTPQIAAQLSIAKEEGLLYYLVVNMQTQVAPEVLARISSHAPSGAEGVAKGMVVRFETSSGKFFRY